MCWCLSGDTLCWYCQNILAALRHDDDEIQQLEALTQLCELLAVSTEEGLSVCPVDQLVPVLVRTAASFARPIIAGHACFQTLTLDQLACFPCRLEMLAADDCVLLGQTNLLNAEHSPDMMLLAARALTFLADVMPSSCTAIVRYGAVPAFCARLLTVEFIDLAEQSLQVRFAGHLFTYRQCLHTGHGNVHPIYLRLMHLRHLDGHC